MSQLQPKNHITKANQDEIISDQQELQNRVALLLREKCELSTINEKLHTYIRAKTNNLLEVMGTLPLRTEELDDVALLQTDPIGIVTESFAQVLENLRNTNANLKLAKEEIQAIFDSAGLAILLVDDQQKLQAFNKKSQQLFFADKANILGQTCCNCICAEKQPPQNCIFNQVMDIGTVAENADFIKDSRHYHVIGTPIKTSAGAITHVVLIYSDITDRIETEDKLRESENRYRTLYSTMREGVAQHRFIYDSDGEPCDYEILDVNDSYEKIMGIKRQQIIGQKASGIYPLFDGKPVCLEQFVATTKQRGTTRFEFDFDYNGSKRILRISSSPLSPGYFAAIFEDITQRRINEEKIERLAFFDNLTGLPNRVLMRDRLGQMVARAKRKLSRISLFFIDLDHFKRINDTLGHDKGDQLLKIVAKRLRKALRDCDSVSRLGGDEFVVLVDEINNREDASLVACKILESMTPPVVLENKEVYTTTSVGIAIFPEDGDDPDTLLKNADTAMYQAKEKGRNTYRFYSSEMNAQGLEKLLLANDLRKALAQNEFRLVYQPQIKLSNGHMTGFEALLRWQHPDLGDIPPDQFIPLAEETGQILSIGRWVLETACQKARAIHDKCGLPLRIAVNLSAKQFQDPDLVAIIRNSLKKSNLSPEFLELEITESILMENFESAQNTLLELKEMGLNLAIDDFGTGYSSLSYLRNFPIDRLKVDKSFIQKMAAHPDDAAITEAIIVMAHILGIRVVAEGVEKKTELEFLREKECDEVQGYYFSKPLTREQLVARILDPSNNNPFCFFNS
ncbi:bifunctional diguanylate cyclase/phosphodiesterase [Malonomonas rubra]|uniref:bifunctional diguanylate cyclase/phosphodiesterase n=1 Tax=Malonomonas rubra TaxID=57040 RepID=UPI0026F2D7CC|nr:bifunctional diguanylate cyclase/phosphodiesterase [Malonomonas rubra]